MLFANLFIYLFNRLFIRLFICLFICLFVYLFIYLIFNIYLIICFKKFGVYGRDFQQRLDSINGAHL